MGRLFWKILLGFWVTLVVVSAAVGFVVHWYAQDRLARATELAGGPRAETSLSAVAVTLQHAGTAATVTLLRQWQATHAAPVLVVDDNGRDLLHRPVRAAALAQARAQVDSGSSTFAARGVTAPDGGKYFLFIPAEFPPPRPFARPLGRPFAYALAFRLGVTLLASLLFSAGLTWYLTRPVRHLRAAARGLAEGALETRVMPRIGARRDEIADLGRDFDHMADRLQTLVGAQKRLLHDVSHELRSPLARLHVAVGLARQQPEKLPATLDRIERETERLDDLVGNVLALSRLEAGESRVTEQYVDVAELLETVITDARFEAEARHCRVALTTDGEFVVLGRDELLRRALENVVRNALKYTAANTTVEVGAGREPGEHRVRITVCDRGPGVSPSDLGTMFEPFFRAEDVRDRDGFGLGLAIAKRAIEAHGGDIHASNRAEGGLCVDITLPLAKTGA